MKMVCGKPKLLHLQGLRGIAILAVVAFHFFPKACMNGYLGVDIFFALTGYLMTMMLERLTFISLTNLLDFWYRRFKRILPFYYLVIFGIIIALFALDGIVRSANLKPAWTGVILATNIIRPSGDDGYFQKLGVAMDMFTHTWSLALEMQFYVLFPFMFLLLKALPMQMKLPFTILIGVSSLVFHISTDNFNSFNSVFSRIWQFVAGTVAFYADDWFGEKNSKKTDEEAALLASDSESSHRSNVIILNTFVLVLVTLFVTPLEVAPTYARINSIIVSFVIIAYGKNCCLENHLLVFIGEISYGWYLIHWPVFAFFKIQTLYDPTNLIGGIILSFLLAVILHYSFERKYLAWSKVTVFSMVFLLLTANVTAVFVLKGMVESRDKLLPISNRTVIMKLPTYYDNRYWFPTDFLESVDYGFENMTSEERIALNKEYNSGDGPRTVAYCKQPIKTSNPKEFRCEFNYLTNKTANATLLLTGNSWAPNIMKTVSESCGHRFSHMEVVAQSGCESLFPAPRGDGWACELDVIYLEGVKRLKPDVLLIFNRFSDSTKLNNGTSPFNDFTFQEAVKRLKEYEKYVKKQILIVDAIPWPNHNIIDRMVDKLSGKTVPEEEDVSFDKRYFTVKQRIARIAAGCKKCKIFDITNLFWFNGEFKLHDPKYLVSFMASTLHLTPAAWSRIKPLLKYMCDNV